MRLSSILLLALAPAASAFAPAQPAARPAVAVPSSSALEMGPPKSDVILSETYGEGSRKYRRTVYTHDQWVKHRSPDRFANNLATLFNSGIYKQIGREVFATTAVAAFVCGWNLLVGGYQDLAGTMHDPILNAQVSI